MAATEETINARKLYCASLRAMALQAEGLLAYAKTRRGSATSVDRLRLIIEVCNEELLN